MYDILLLSNNTTLIVKTLTPCSHNQSPFSVVCSHCSTTSHFVHIVLAYHHICSASFERAKVSNFHLSIPRPKMTVSIVKHTPTFSCLLFLVYLSCHTTAYLPPLFYRKKIPRLAARHIFCDDRLKLWTYTFRYEYRRGSCLLR